MPSLNPYLNFKNNCEEAFNHYKSVFGGEIPFMMRFKDAPKEYQGKESEANLIMHMSLPVGSSMLMGSDMPDGMGNLDTGNNVSISITADSKEQADKYYKGLSEGGKAHMPMSDAFWGDYFGMLTDKFGINWMISYSDRQHG